MMRPPSRSSGRKLSVTAITPATLTLSVGSTMLARSQPSRSSRTPALLTSASSGLLAEHAAATAEAAAAMVALFVTSSSTGTTCTLPQLSVAASAAPLCVSRQPRNKTCSPPRAEMASAIARPMTRVAPVTKTRIDAVDATSPTEAANRGRQPGRHVANRARAPSARVPRRQQADEIVCSSKHVTSPWLHRSNLFGEGSSISKSTSTAIASSAALASIASTPT